MAGLFVEGISFGLILAILLGPIFIVLTQGALQGGKPGGMIVASGVWFSDLLFILSTYFFISKLADVVESEGFDFWASMIGGVILIIFGIISFLKKSNLSQESFKQKLDLKSFSNYFMKGFLVNTVNPFSIVFWLSVVTTNVVGRGLSSMEATAFLGGTFLTIVLTDTCKVFLADVIRNRMKDRYFQLFNKIAGIALAIFGIYLLLRIAST